MKSAESRDSLKRLEGFLRDYTQGMNARDLRRLFERDAAHAYAVLTREHGEQPEPKDWFQRSLFRARLAFLGLSYKLSPARRLVFALSLLFFLLGLVQDPSVMVKAGTARVTIDLSALWFGLSLASMGYLLALELVDRVRVRDELEVARELQADLLPKQAPRLSDYLFAHSYRTANEVGGDYYEFTPLPDGRIALMVGDASGHGMAAGLVMAIANATIETALDLDPSPERVLTLLNRTLCRTGNRRTFMSLFYALLDPATGRLDYTCAGHPFPLLRRADGEVEELGCGGLPLGIREPIAPVCQSVTLEPGDLLLLYTDGLAEATDPTGMEAFSFERVGALVRAGGSAQAVHDRILEAFDQHVSGEPLRDDLTLVVVMRLPFPLPPPPPSLESGPPQPT
jgi:sigma-B regulation protein RsbU (phosphoserine phosphatase)